MTTVERKLKNNWDKEIVKNMRGELKCCERRKP